MHLSSPDPRSCSAVLTPCVDGRHRSPASYTQAARLRNQERYGPCAAIFNLFVVPPDRDVEQIRASVASIVAREHTFSITGGERRPDGTFEIAYSAPSTDLPLTVVDCDTSTEAETLCRARAASGFAERGGLLWEVMVFRLRADGSLAVGLVCDHLMTDGRSLWLFEQELRHGRRDDHGLARPYVAWLHRQLAQYTGELGAAGRDAAEFWTKYLEGREADAATLVDFARDEIRPFRGAATTVSTALGLSVHDLQTRAAAIRSLPLALVLSSTAAAASLYTSADSLSTRVITHGRPRGFSRTHGFFADSLPMIWRPEPGAGPEAFIEESTQYLHRVSRFQDAPWDFIRTRCSRTGQRLDDEPGARQLVVNLVPYDVDQWPSDAIETVVHHGGHIESLHLSVAPRSDGCGRLSATFNPDHFEVAGVQHFVNDVATLLQRTCA